MDNWGRATLTMGIAFSVYTLSKAIETASDNFRVGSDNLRLGSETHRGGTFMYVAQMMHSAVEHEKKCQTSKTH